MRTRILVYLALSLMALAGCSAWKAASKSTYRCPDAQCFPFGYEPAGP